MPFNVPLPESPESVQVIPSTPGEYHPEFLASSGPDFEVTLISCDRVRFRVSANILKSASGFFEQALSLPQPTGSTDERIIDNISEGSGTLAALLRMVTGKGIPDFDTLATMEPLLFAAEKYEMRVPAAIMRLILLTTPSFLENHMQLYTLGSRLGWEDVAKAASRNSCYLDFFDAALQPTLRRADPGDLLTLMAFHRRRRDSMDQFLQNGELAGLECRWTDPPILLENTREFENFRWKILEEMDRTPPRSSISVERIREIYASSFLQDLHGHDHPHDHYGGLECFSPFQIDIFQAISQYWTLIPQTV